MPVTVPRGLTESIDRWCARHAERRAARIAQPAEEEDPAPRVCLIGAPHRRSPTPECLAAAHTAIELLDILEIEDIRERLADAGLRRIPLFGPYTRDGRPTWARSGARWFELSTGRPPALIHLHRTGPDSGKKKRLTSEKESVETVPAAICLRIAQDIESGAVWRRLCDELTRGEV